MAVLVLPTGAVTAGVLRGARRVIKDFGNAVKACIGDSPGHFKIGGVSLTAFSVTVLRVREEIKTLDVLTYNLPEPDEFLQFVFVRI